MSSRLAYAYGALLALGLAYFLIRMPYQVSDDLEHILVMQFQSYRGLVEDSLTGDGSLRPLQWVQQKVLFQLAPAGAYWDTFKAFHALQLLVVVALFVRLLRIRAATDLIALPLALAALVGMHTFNITMREAYPVNHFMTILVCCLAVANLAMSRPAWWRDVAAVAILAYALLTLETGLLVWVCMVAAYLARWRGLSWKALAAATCVLAAYLVVRFVVLDVGTRGLAAMSSGYGFSVRGTGDLEELFGDAPWTFYLYNIVSSVLTVLLSEPRAGVFQFTSFVVRGDVPPWSIVNVAVSAIGTAVIAVHIVRRIRALWRGEGLDESDGLLLIFVAVLGSNAVISYPYTKDVIVSPAGMFYAAALFTAVRSLVASPQVRPLAAVALLVPLLVLSAGWTLRAGGLVATMRDTAFVNRGDWAVAEDYLERNRPRWRDRHPDAEQLFVALQDDVIRTPVPQLYETPRWTRRWFDPY
ncbi:MAG: hypothetical protein FJW14_09780 [Acidimicrobiia bacterium]|nr:hypothetical protein [Acidimicrobiia bacterium]